MHFLTTAVGCPVVDGTEVPQKRSIPDTDFWDPESLDSVRSSRAERCKCKSGGTRAHTGQCRPPSPSISPGLTWGRWGAAPARHECTSCGTGAHRGGQPRAPERESPRRCCSPPARSCHPAWWLRRRRAADRGRGEAGRGLWGGGGGALCQGAAPGRRPQGPPARGQPGRLQHQQSQLLVNKVNCVLLADRGSAPRLVNDLGKICSLLPWMSLQKLKAAVTA